MTEERKLVTIFFADVTGSTTLGDTLDPEDVRTLMGRYYAHARNIVPSYGGTLEKFIGDAVMAVFGQPQAHGDDAERALAAALTLRDAVSNDPVLGRSFLLRIGINTGEVIATNDLSKDDFLVTGDAVNIAARLQQYANPGEIIVGERTMRAAQRAFSFEDVRLISVKGKHQPQRVFPLKCARGKRQVDSPPFVGRRQDLLQLALLQARTLEERVPQLISLVAPAGTGKSRLIEEFLHRLDPSEGFQVATVRCLPYGHTLTYWPLRSLLSELLHGEISRQRVIDTFRQGEYEPEDAEDFADYVLTALGVEQERTQDIKRECIFMAWRLLIEIFAQQAPRVLLFEDLHWASDSLLDMVEHIINLRVQAPILLITLSRPELLDRRPHWGGGHQNFTSLALQPLTTMQTRDLVDRLQRDIAEATCEQIVERSGGNPFFAIELIRGLASTSITLDRLPDTVHAAILARLDLLSLKERTVLQVAAASRTFRPAMLEAALDEFTPQEIEEAIEGLQARDLIVPLSGGAFTFRHILIRDVAYGTLSRSERIRLHARIAIYLETVAGDRLDEFTELIAYHYLEAIRLARQSAIALDVPTQPEHAIRFLRRAGELASRAGAFAEARNHLQSAIEIAPESEQASLYELLGDSMVWGDTAVESYLKALEIWRNGDMTHSLTGARLLRKLLVCYTRGLGGKNFAADNIPGMYAEAQQLAELANDEDELWRIHVADLFYEHQANVSATRMEEKRKIALSALEYFQRKEDWPAFSEACDGYAVLSMEIGAYHDALEISKRRLTVPDLPVIERGDAIQMIAKIYVLLDDYDACIATIRQALDQLRPGQPLLLLCASISHAIFAAYVSGRWSEADEFLPPLQKMWEQCQDNLDLASFVVGGYFGILQIALAREDRPIIDAATSALCRIYPDPTSPWRVLLSALLTDEIPKSEQPFHYYAKMHFATTILTFHNERGVAITITKPGAGTICERDEHSSSFSIYEEIATALAINDNERLASALDAAEAHHLLVHAARMRIVLAQRTKDRRELERARLVLERLGDRQFLCRLQEVEAMLSGHAVA